MIRNNQDLINHLAAGEPVKYLHFWGHTQKSASTDKSCLSQWFPASFIVEGDTYLTAEHFMMAQKARLFGDTKMLQAILDCEHPGAAKKFGRQVKGFIPEEWDQQCFDYVVRGNVAKFGQNPELLKFLLNTKDRVLVEASPRDRIWGIGMGVNHSDACNPGRWSGKNLLGFALMNAREALRNSKEKQ